MAILCVPLIYYITLILYNCHSLSVYSIKLNLVVVVAREGGSGGGEVDRSGTSLETLMGSLLTTLVAALCLVAQQHGRELLVLCLPTSAGVRCVTSLDLFLLIMVLWALFPAR